jgi:F-type H+-transporting ATPase subunit gamma
MKAALRFLDTKPGINVDLEAVGRKSRDFFRRRYPLNLAEEREDESVAAQIETAARNPEFEFHAPELADVGEHPRIAPTQLVGEHVGILNKLTFAEARDIAESVIERYTQGRVDAVYVIYNEFKSVISQRLVVEEVLPIRQIGVADVALAEEVMTAEERSHAVAVAGEAGLSVKGPDTGEIDRQAAGFAAGTDYLYEQSAVELFHDLLPKYVAVQVFRAMAESVAAEHAARMTAMDSATNNATDMIDSLTLVMNRARQAKITKEIIEIVSGAAAM